MKLARYSAVFLALIYVISPAQNRQIDSLKKIISVAKDDTNKVKQLVMVSSRYGQRGDFDSCLVYAQKVLDLSTKLNFKSGLAAAYSNFGIVSKERANYPLALQYGFKALKMREEIGNKNFIAGALNNIATIYKELKNLDKALEYNMRSLRIKEEIKEASGIAASLNNIATILALQKNDSAALRYNMRALAIREKIKDASGIALSLNNIGNIYKRKKEYGIALQHHMRSLKIRETLNDKKGISMSLDNIAGVCEDEKKWQEAATYAERSLKVAKEANLLTEEINAEYSLYTIYEAMHNYDASLKNYKAYIANKDKVFNEENTKREVRLEMNYEFDKKEAAARAEQEKKEAIAAAEKKKQQFVFYTICGFLVLVICFAAFAFRSYRIKRKANIEIQRQKELIEEKQREILDSIYYARRIQDAVITSERYIERVLGKWRG